MRLSRREVLSALLGAPLAATIAGGCERADGGASAATGGEPVVGELLGQSHRVGHRLRKPPSDADFASATTRRTQVAIIGGGPAALSAGYRLAKRGIGEFELLELEPQVGGTSASGSSEVTAYPWGAHYITAPKAQNTELVALLDEMGVSEGRHGDGRPRIAEQYLVRQPKERLFYRGYWYPDLYPRVGASVDDLAQLERFHALIEEHAKLVDGSGRPAFTLPVSHCSDDARFTALDRIGARDWLLQQGLTSERLHWYADYACRDDYGLSLSLTSAWALLFYHASRMLPDGTPTPVITWPQGNGALTAHLRRGMSAGRERIHAGHLVVDVLPAQGGGVRVHAIEVASDRPVVIEAQRAIVATPQFITRRIVRPLRDAPGPDPRADFDYGAWMVANLHLRDRPGSRGMQEAWDNVLHDSPSLGYVSATHQRGRSFGETVWTYYLPMTDAKAADGRKRLLQADWGHYRDAVTADIGRAHPDLHAQLRRLDVWRWGHGMVQPRPGFVSGASRRIARQPVGAIHFAHSDLSGVALFEEAFDHGLRAADEVVAALRVGAAPVSIHQRTDGDAVTR